MRFVGIFLHFETLWCYFFPPLINHRKAVQCNSNLRGRADLKNNEKALRTCTRIWERQSPLVFLNSTNESLMSPLINHINVCFGLWEGGKKAYVRVRNARHAWFYRDRGERCTRENLFISPYVLCKWGGLPATVRVITSLLTRPPGLACNEIEAFGWNDLSHSLSFHLLTCACTHLSVHVKGWGSGRQTITVKTKKKKELGK